MANAQPGDDVAVFGAGPIVYFAVMNSFLRGTAKVFSIDHLGNSFEQDQRSWYRNNLFRVEDPVEKIKMERGGRGVTCIDGPIGSSWSYR